MNQRRAKRPAASHERHGSGVITPSRAEVRAAVEGLSPDLSWEELRDGLRPVFIRRRPLPPGIERPLLTRLPPGLDVALGVDIGPAFMYVGNSMIGGWGVDFETAFKQAMENLRAVIAAERYAEMEYEAIDGVPFWWYQSRGGIASGLLLLEEELNKRYGDEPRLLVAPMRNLLLAAPYEADRDLVAWVRDEISHEDPNGLDLPILALVDGKLKIDAAAPANRLARVH